MVPTPERERSSMTIVYGEVVVDLFSGPPERPAEGARLFHFRGVPGGAPCNVAVQLAHAGEQVALIASFADDPIGSELKGMLIERRVDLSRSFTHPRTRTPIALVTSLPDKDRTFRLYLTGSAVEQLTVDELPDDILAGADWFHFGSVLMAFPNPRAVTQRLVEKARGQGLVTSCDVNIRPDVWQESAVERTALLDVLPYVDLVKMSDDDFLWLKQQFPERLKEPTDVFDYGPQVIALTHGADGATLLTKHFAVQIPAPKVEVVDTTGAGDAFMAGLVTSLKGQGVRTRSNLAGAGKETLQQAGQFAAEQAGRILTKWGAMP